MSSLRNRVTPAGVIAIIALVFAMVGGAFAASNGLSGKQKKEVTKIAKSFAGKPGANGVNGAPGAAGKEGPAGKPGSNGTNGTNGTNGKNVEVAALSGAECGGNGGAKVQVEGSPATEQKICNGQTGFTETLPPGETETGSWGANLPQATTGGYVPISFAIPLAAELGEANVHLIPIGEEGEEGCTGGTAVEPKADPGNLCVFVANEAGGGAIAGIGKIGSESLEVGASVTGAFLFLISASESAMAARGTFAVTAAPAP